MNVDESMMQRVCDFICDYNSSKEWICKEFYQYLYNKDCKSCCEKCKFFNPGDMMKWMEGKQWK